MPIAAKVFVPSELPSPAPFASSIVRSSSRPISPRRGGVDVPVEEEDLLPETSATAVAMRRRARRSPWKPVAGRPTRSPYAVASETASAWVALRDRRR
jgi:hypothetical protein